MNTTISSNFTKVENTKIHYLEAGKGEAILLLHGWPTSSYLWRNILPTLAQNNRVIAIDLPGFGQSDKHLEDSYSFRYYSRIIEGFLTDIEVEKVTLGLHDLGGPLGMHWATQNREKVAGLIFLNTLIYPEFSWAVKLFGLASYLPIVKSMLSSPSGIERAMNFGVHQKQKLDKVVIQNYQAPFNDPVSRKVLLKTVQNLSPKGFREVSQQLSAFNCPVQILYGEKDKILPDVKNTMERLKNDLPQANVISLPDCGHFLQEEVPGQIGAILLDFLKKNA